MSDIYSPLPPGNFIRLLEIREVRGGSSVHDLIGNFKVVSLNDCSDKYLAVSYAWRDPAPVATIQLRDGRSLPLSRTLTDLFDSLRQRYQSLTVWIDALCINQKNTPEKEHQVRLMGQVYSLADQVLLWLGTSTPDTKTALKFMVSKQTLSWPEDWENEPEGALTHLEEVFFLLSRAWFQRAWVIQEVILNDNVLMLCGSDSLDFDNFRHCVFAIWKYFERLSDYGGEHLAIRGLWNVTRLLFLRDEFQDCGEVRFERLLETAYHCEASDPRDKVFAFWGIAERQRPVPEPTYTSSFEEVYLKTAEALLCSGMPLDLLALGGIAVRTLPTSLPTWVPDLRNHSFSEPFVPCDRANWDTGGPTETAPTRVGSDHIRLQVRPFDVVAVTCPIFDSTSVASQQTAIREVLGLRRMLPSEISDSAWMDLLATTLIFGLDIEDEPAGPEYREYFGEWLSWLQSSTSEEDLVRIRRNRYHRTIGPRIDGWKAYVTRRGFLCIGPPDVAVGDLICAVPGCRFPIVLRPEESQPPATLGVAGPGFEALPDHVLISWCFVQGMMYGEALTQDQSLVEILIH
jgi:hypothetical protein